MLFREDYGSLKDSFDIATNEWCPMDSPCQERSTSGGSIQYNVVINDLLCFISNNLSTLSTNTLCRMCLETYSLNDILHAYSIFNDVRTSGTGTEIITPALSRQLPLGEKTLRKLIRAFQRQNFQNDDMPKFVSCGLHLPKSSSYCENAIVVPVLEEVQVLKESFIQQQQSLHNEILALRHEISQLAAQRAKGILYIMVRTNNCTFCQIIIIF